MGRRGKVPRSPREYRESASDATRGGTADRSPARDTRDPAAAPRIFYAGALWALTGRRERRGKIEGVAALQRKGESGGVSAALTSFGEVLHVHDNLLASWVSPAILDSLSPSTMIEESTAADLGIHSLEPARLGAWRPCWWGGRQRGAAGGDAGRSHALGGCAGECACRWAPRPTVRT